MNEYECIKLKARSPFWRQLSKNPVGLHYREQQGWRRVGVKGVQEDLGWNECKAKKERGVKPDSLVLIQEVVDGTIQSNKNYREHSAEFGTL